MSDEPGMDLVRLALDKHLRVRGDGWIDGLSIELTCSAVLWALRDAGWSPPAPSHIQAYEMDEPPK